MCYLWDVLSLHLFQDELIGASGIGAILSIFGDVVAAFFFAQFLVEFANATSGGTGSLVGIKQWQEPAFYLLEADSKDNTMPVCFVEFFINVL